MVAMTIDPPAFREGSDYPNGGKFVGVAWAAAWALLADGDWHATDDLCDAMAVAVPTASRKTFLTLLSGSRAAEITEVRYERGGKPARVRAVAYRRVPAGT